MKFFFACIILLATTLPAMAQTKTAQNNVEDFLRARTEKFMEARQARKADVLRTYYDPADVKKMHDFLKFNFTSVKKDMQKGVFTAEYVKSSVEDGDFGDVYKEAILNYLFKNVDFDRELQNAFPRFLADYKYKIDKFTIDRAKVAEDGKSAIVYITEYRLMPDAKEGVAASRGYRWQLKNGTWFLAMDTSAHL
jgi:hypothetical protein